MKHLNTRHQLGSRNLRTGLVALLSVIFATAITVTGQKTTNKPDQNLKSMARVNPSTLAMEFSLPLFSYPGRAGNSLPESFSYSSKVWTMERGNYRSDQLFPYPDPGYRVFQSTNMLWARFSFEKVAGWTSSLMPPILIENGIYTISSVMTFCLASCQVEVNSTANSTAIQMKLSRRA